MKRVAVFLTLIVSPYLGSCSDPLEKRSGDEVQSQLERGVTGEGRIGPENRPPDDPANEHGIPTNHP